MGHFPLLRLRHGPQLLRMNINQLGSLASIKIEGREGANKGEIPGLKL